ncbi:MAG: protein kinase domain-containing protein [Actinomycetota bacterium]
MASEMVTLAERYVLESEIARGGMAIVFKARDDVLARPVAVKVLHSHLAEDEAFLERFRFEALAAARLAHPNIVSIYDTGAEQPDPGGEPRHYIVMEYCGGGSLAEHIVKEGALPPERAAVVGSSVCEALAYAHRSGVIHRDIKPANVLVAESGGLKVADFGIAKAAFTEGDVTTTGSILGTVTYLSPEQLKGEEPDQRSDIYSLGVTLYELLAGRAPFEEETQMAIAMKHLREEPPPLRSVKAGIPRGLEGVVAKAMAKDPDERYQSAQEMRNALEGQSSATATAVLRRPARSTERARTTVQRTRRPQREKQSRSMGPFLMLGIIAVVVAVASIVLLSLFNRDPGTGGNGSDGNGGQGNGEGSGDAETIEVQSVTDFDPVGGDGEHPEEVDLAVDGDPNTAWTTENYQDPLSALGKDGVGLVFDLGDGVEVASVEVQGCSDCGLLVGHAAEPASDASGFETADETDAAGDPEPFEFDPVADRYWLVFVTELPGGGGGSASISEVTFGAP